MTYKYSQYNYITEIPDEKAWLLFNFYSKGLLKLDEEHKKKNDLIINNSENIKKIFNKNEVEILKSNGFVVDNNLNELNRVIYRYNKSYMQSNTLYLVILPTLACNFNCHYCFEGVKSNPVSISDEHISKIGEFINYRFQNNKNLDNVHIHLYGGEPLLAVNRIKEIYEMINKLKKKLKFSLTGFMTTNGFLLTKDNIDLLLKKNVKTIMVSFDGSKDIHNKSRTHKDPKVKDTYSTILKNCINFLRKDKHNNLILRIHLNYESIDDYDKVLWDFPSDLREQINPILVPIFGSKFQHIEFDKIFPKLQLNIKKIGYMRSKANYFMLGPISGCEFTSSLESYLISADGNMYFCTHQDFTNKGLSNKLFLSHIDDYENLENQPNYYNFYGNYFFSKANCLKCILLPVCGGGCRVKDYQNKNFIGNEECPIFRIKKKHLDKDIISLYHGEKIREVYNGSSHERV